MKYKKLYGKEEFELIPYVKEYLENNEGIELLIGCDSQNFSDKTIYAIVVALYFPGPKPKWIDIDLNPDPRFKSNEVFRQAVGLVEGMGYEVRYKTLGPIATYAADHLVKL